MSYQPVDYATAFFEFPNLDKIVGKPSYKTLKSLKKQQRANSISVVLSDLGSGGFGHLGLVLTPAEYASIANVLYTCPVHPGPLDIQPGTAHHEAVRLRDDHREIISLFRETLQVERALLKQIVSAVDPEYLRKLCNKATNTINMSLPEVLAHLFTHYGTVLDSEDLDKEEKVLQTYVWNINDQPIHIFNQVEELASMSTAANLEKSERQIISIAIDIIRRTGDLETALLQWEIRPANQQTWIAFKAHFNAAHRALKRIRGPTMRNTAFHQAHQVATDLKSEFENMRDDIVVSWMNAVTMNHHDSALLVVPPPTPSMHATTNDHFLAAIKKIVQDQMKNNHNDQSNDRGRQYNNGYNNGGCGYNNGAQQQRRPCRYTSQYCWSHGACSHKGKDCNNKRQGHKDEATIKNKMGGSTYYCTE